MEWINYLPEWLISDEVWEKADKINEMLDKDPSIRKTINILESTKLDDRFKYYPQIETVNQCLKDIFWDDYQLIIITNYFLAYLEDFIEAYYNFNNDNNDDNNELRYESEKSSFRHLLSESWINFFNKLEKENPHLWFQELSKLRREYKRNFVNLIIERIQYIPNDENRTK